MVSCWSITFSVVGLVVLSHRMICTYADSDCSRLQASDRVQSTRESTDLASCRNHQHLRVLCVVVNAYLPMAVSRAVSGKLCEPGSKNAGRKRTAALARNASWTCFRPPRQPEGLVRRSLEPRPSPSLTVLHSICALYPSLWR